MSPTGRPEGEHRSAQHEGIPASAREFRAKHAMGSRVEGIALVAKDGFSARYDLDRITGVFSRPAHKLAGQSYRDRILVLDTALADLTMLAGFDCDITSALASGARLELLPGQRLLRAIAPAP